MSDQPEQMMISAREHEDGEMLRARFFDFSTDDSRSKLPDPNRPRPSKRPRKPPSPITPRTP